MALQGADIAGDIEGHSSVVAAAMPLIPSCQRGPGDSFKEVWVLTGKADVWNAILDIAPSPQPERTNDPVFEVCGPPPSR
jgi:hypothetical protein